MYSAKAGEAAKASTTATKPSDLSTMPTGPVLVSPRSTWCDPNTSDLPDARVYLVLAVT